MRVSLIALFLFFCRLGYCQPDIPDQGGYWVHDEAKILSAQAKSRLESIIRAEADSTSNQIGVLIIPSLQGNSIEEFSLRVAEAWKIGQRDKDNGVLLFIAVEDRKLRIETGYGLEGALTDAVSSRIIRNEIAPRFRENDYDGGVEAGLMAIIQAIKGEYVNDEPVVQKRNSKRSPLLTIIIIIIIIILISRRKRGGGGHWSSGRGWIGPIGGGFGGSSWGSGGGFSGGSFGGGGGFGGGGSSGSW